MKALVAHGAKDLRLEEREDRAVGPDQVAVRIAVGGICGSDLHYYRHGGFGSVRLREPMILGHEVSGYVEDVGENVEGLSPGQLVSVSPSRPCRHCRYCDDGLFNHCMNMRFYGSAMPFPHIQGAFREVLIADAAQCVPADGLDPGVAAMAEPLAVVLHAAKQAGDLFGRRVLVTGCGPIGMLAILVARAAGAIEIVATDISPFTLAMAKTHGAGRALNVSEEPDALDQYSAKKGHFDVLFECSGINSALSSAIPAMRPSGTVIQLGLGGDMTLPVQAMTAKELNFRGSFRFHSEFSLAVDLMRSQKLDVADLITQTFPLEHAIDAFDTASNRSISIKAQIAFHGSGH